MHLQRKQHYLTLGRGQDHTKCCPVPSTSKFDVYTSNSLGGDTIARNLTDVWTDRQKDRQMDGQKMGVNIEYICTTGTCHKLLE